ncbi:unnamed protein product, partial [Closterium sp. NIES-54]
MNPSMYRSISNFSPFYLTVGARWVSGAFLLAPGELSGAFLLAPSEPSGAFLLAPVVKLYGFVPSGLNLSSPFSPPPLPACSTIARSYVSAATLGDGQVVKLYGFGSGNVPVQGLGLVEGAAARAAGKAAIE